MSPYPSYTFELVGPVHSIYVGSGPSKTLSRGDRDQIFSLCTARFQSYTYFEACGCFRSESEQTLMIQVATHDTTAVKSLASDIALAQDQLGVGYVGPDEQGILAYGRVVPNRIVKK